MNNEIFCVDCGKKGTIFREGVCTKCYIKNHNFSKGPEIIDVSFCTNCLSYKIKNIWTLELFSDIIRKVVKNNFQMSKDLENIDIAAECIDNLDGKYCKVFITGHVEDETITEKHQLLVRLKRTVCDVCSKQAGGYYEAIIQVRADRRAVNKKSIEDIKNLVENLVQDMINKGNRTLFISDMGEEHGGYDFYLSDKSAAITILNKIHEKYGGDIKKSSKDVGMKDSRQIKRMTYLIRLPSYRKRDFIYFENKYYFVKAVTGKKVILINLSNWNEITFESKSMKKAKVLGGQDLIREVMLISQTENEVQIMDLKSYRTYEIKKPKIINFDNIHLKLIKINEKKFLLPI